MIDAVGAALLGLASAGSASAPADIAAPPLSEDVAAPALSAAADFARLAALEGEWRNAEQPGSALRIRFATAAGGTVLQESWFAGERLHSLTIYHRDGDAMVLTHYCPQGNQPTLVQIHGGDTPGFTFRSATDLDTAQESHLHALSFDLTNPDRPVRREVYRSAAGDEPSQIVLERAPPRHL